MNLPKSFGNAFFDRVLEVLAVTDPDIDHRLDGPARFWADPPPGHHRIVV